MKLPMVVLVIMSVLMACKTTVVGLQQDPSFSYIETIQNQFVVAGVTSSVEKLDDITRVRFGDQLARQFHEERPEINIIRSGLLAKEVGSGLLGCSR